MNDQREEMARGTLRADQETRERAAGAREKKPFVEPAVSVPADVLEATALFQAPTIQTSVVP